MVLEFFSPAFGQGERIPKAYTCRGQGLSPPFSWLGAPPETLSYLLVCTHPRAGRGEPVHHWAVYDIDPDLDGLPGGLSAVSETAQLRQAVNDKGLPGYLPPCPAAGQGEEHFHFRLCALHEATLPVASYASCVEVIATAQPFILDFREWVGVCGR